MIARLIWRLGSRWLPLRFLPYGRALRAFVEAWVTADPEERINLLTRGMAPKSPSRKGFEAIGTVRRGFAFVWTPELEEKAREHYCTDSCPRPGLAEISGVALQLGSMTGLVPLHLY